MKTRNLLACGVIVAPIYAAADIVMSVRYPGYSYVHQTISELNAFGAPTRTLSIVFGFVISALLTALGIGTWKAAAGNHRLRATGTLLTGFGVLSIFAVPLASMQMRGAEQGLAGAIHIGSAVVAVLMLTTAIGFAAAALGGPFRLYSVATILVLLGFGMWAGMDSPLIERGLATPWVGVKERIAFYAYYAWFALFAVTLLRRSRRAGTADYAVAPTDALKASDGRPVSIPA